MRWPSVSFTRRKEKKIIPISIRMFVFVSRGVFLEYGLYMCFVPRDEPRRDSSKVEGRVFLCRGISFFEYGLYMFAVPCAIHLQ